MSALLSRTAVFAVSLKIHLQLVTASLRITICWKSMGRTLLALRTKKSRALWTLLGRASLLPSCPSSFTTTWLKSKFCFLNFFFMVDENTRCCFLSIEIVYYSNTKKYHFDLFFCIACRAICWRRRWITPFPTCKEDGASRHASKRAYIASACLIVWFSLFFVCLGHFLLLLTPSPSGVIAMVVSNV